MSNRKPHGCWLALCVTLLVGCTPQRRCSAKRPDPLRRPTGKSVPVGRQQVVDLTQPLQPGMVIRPGEVPFEMTSVVQYDQGYRLHKLQLGERTGTHVDAPAQLVPKARSVDRLRADELVLPAVVLDLRDKVARDADYQISASDVLDWEAVHGQVPVGCLVIANTGWAEHFSTPTKYLGQDAHGLMHFPGFGAAAARLLVTERDVAGLGIDTLSIDAGAATDLAAHRVLLEADKVGIENLTNLGALPETGATVVIGVLPVVDGAAAPARVIALVVEEPKPAFGAEAP